MPKNVSDSRTSLDVSLERHLQVAFKACEGAKVILNKYFGNLKNVDEKFQAGLVSEADRESEIFIKKEIRSVVPEHAILGEESGLTGTAPVPSERRGALWMIDPLDGTTNYVHRFPFFCVSIGLELDGELVLGVVDAPKLGMRFHAVKGGGAFVNGEAMRVSPRLKFRDGLFATGFSSKDTQIEKQLRLAERAILEGRGIRRAGAAALDLCFVANGVFDCFWEKDLSPWDMAAGVVIAREAGAIATDMFGAPFDQRGTSVLCGTPALHGELLKLIREVYI